MIQSSVFLSCQKTRNVLDFSVRPVAYITGFGGRLQSSEEEMDQMVVVIAFELDGQQGRTQND